MPKSIIINNIKTPIVTRVKKSLSALLGATALLSLGLSTPVMADDFVITSGDTTNNGETINGGDTVSVTGTIDTGTTNDEGGIETTGSNTITVSTDGIIKTGGTGADGIWNQDNTNTTTVSGSITTLNDASAGVHNESDSNKTIVSGSITTSGRYGHGIANVGDTNTTTVSGSIATGNVSSNGGRESYGIYNEGNNNTTTLSGDITTINWSGYGIYNKGNKNTTIMSGSITASGERDASNYGIYNRGDENITTMSGSISTVGSSSYGIYNNGDTNTITMSGSITTEGNSARGIYNSGDNNTNTVSGSITTSGKNGSGINNYGDTNINTVSGSITTSGEDGSGIYNDGNTNTNTVSGTITTSGEEGHGIYNFIFNDGGSNTNTVSGTITTSGKKGYGIYNKGDTNKTTMSGSITTSGEEGRGIYNEGDTNTTTMSGSITTSGVSAYGIYNTGDTNKTTVSGSITTSGARGFGIYDQGNKNTTIMSGSITSTGGLAQMGIAIQGDNNNTTVSGSISLNDIDDNSGFLSENLDSGNGIGLYYLGDNNSANISGSITVIRPYAYGIALQGDDNTVSISGTVSAKGDKSIALYPVDGDGNIFTLNEGAVIIGQIRSGYINADNLNKPTTNSELVFNLGKSKSYAFYVAGNGVGTGTGQWTFSDLDGRSQIVTAGTTGCDLTDEKYGYSKPTICNLVTAVSASNAEVQNELSYLNNSAVVNSLRGAKATHKDAEGNGAWVDLYTGSSKRTASTTDLTVLSFKSNTSGLTIGSPFMIGSTTQADFVFNTSRTNLDLSSAKDQTVKLTANKVGLVLDDLAPSSGWNVGAFGLVGANSYKGTRKVMTNTSATGSESITSDYRGTEVIVGASVDKVQPISDTIRFEGGIDFNYTNENIAGYSESKYFTWGSRRTTHAAAGITAGLVYEKDGLTTFGRVGTQRSNLMDGKTATYTNNGTAGSYTDSAKSDTYNTVSIGVSYKGSNGMSITGDISNSTSNNKVSGAITRLGFNWEF